MSFYFEIFFQSSYKFKQKGGTSLTGGSSVRSLSSRRPFSIKWFFSLLWCHHCKYGGFFMAALNRYEKTLGYRMYTYLFARPHVLQYLFSLGVFVQMEPNISLTVGKCKYFFYTLRITIPSASRFFWVGVLFSSLTKRKWERICFCWIPHFYFTHLEKRFYF